MRTFNAAETNVSCVCLCSFFESPNVLERHFKKIILKRYFRSPNKNEREDIDMRSGYRYTVGMRDTLSCSRSHLLLLLA